MKKVTKTILLFGILLIITLCFLTAKDVFSSNPQTFQKEDPVKKIYKKINDIELGLTIYYPRLYEKRLPLPVIVFFFGGGWKSGSVEQFSPHARYFASRGMIAILADYRVKSRHNTTPFESVMDAKSAIRYIREHHKDLGIDPNKIVASGGSAGGHLAASTAILPGFEEQNENPDISPSPNALILFNPVVNTTEEGYGFERLGTKVEDMSPEHHVRSGLPPTIIFHGTIDTTVPYSNVVDFKNKMIDAGNRCELFSFEGEGHGFFNFNRKGGEYYNRTVYHADKFLISLDYLKGEPTIKPLMIE